MTQVKFILELLKLLSDCLLSCGCTYIKVLLWFIQEVFKLVFIYSLNFINAWPLLFIVVEYMLQLF